MKVMVEEIIVPAGSSLGFGRGTTDDGSVEVIFAGDHRAMRDLAMSLIDVPPPAEVEVPESAVIAMREKGR